MPPSPSRRSGGDSPPPWLDRLLVVDPAGEPVFGRLREDRPADGEALADRVAARIANAAISSFGASSPRSRTPRQWGSWAAISSAIAAQAESLPGCGSFHQSGRRPARKPGHGAGEGALVDRGVRLARDHLEQQVEAVASAGVGQDQHLPLLLAAEILGVVGMIEDEALDAVLGGPSAQGAAQIRPALEAQGARARQLDRPADPQALPVAWSSASWPKRPSSRMPPSLRPSAVIIAALSASRLK